MTPEVCAILRKLKQHKPFVLIISNYFPMNYVASGIHSISGFPLMCDTEKELEEILKISSAVLINLGMLDNEFIKLCNQVCTKANQMNIPITFDLAGADVSQYRIKTVRMMLTNHQISVISGYAHEIICLLAGELTNQITHQPIDEKRLIENAKSLAEKHNITTAISGKKHMIINSNHMKQFNFDSELVQNVAGINNLLAGIISTFSAIEKDPFIATMNAVHFYAGCVGPSSSEASGPASLITKIIDHLYTNAARAQPMTL